jgi:hypothetical protein
MRDIIAVQYDLHPKIISQWKQVFLENASIIFEQKRSNSNQKLVIYVIVALLNAVD